MAIIEADQFETRNTTQDKASLKFVASAIKVCGYKHALLGMSRYYAAMTNSVFWSLKHELLVHFFALYIAKFVFQGVVTTLPTQRIHLAKHHLTLQFTQTECCRLGVLSMMLSDIEYFYVTL